MMSSNEETRRQNARSNIVDIMTLSMAICMSMVCVMFALPFCWCLQKSCQHGSTNVCGVSHACLHFLSSMIRLIQHRENLSNITSSTRGKLHNDSMSNDQNLTLHHVCICFIPCLELMSDPCKPNLLHMEQFTWLFGNYVVTFFYPRNHELCSIMNLTCATLQVGKNLKLICTLVLMGTFPLLAR